MTYALSLGNWPYFIVKYVEDGGLISRLRKIQDLQKFWASGGGAPFESGDEACMHLIALRSCRRGMDLSP
jgi:hypothetical protein